MNYFMRIAFRGRDFNGTQKLKDKITVQSMLEEKLTSIFDENIKVKIGSRLDKGVSALDFGVNFKTSIEKVKPNKLQYVLNRLLPNFIRIKECREVADDFNARYDAISKTYLYVIERKVENPLLIEVCWHPIFDFDIETFRNVSKLYVGNHCFDFFGSEEEKDGKILSIEDVWVEEKGNYVLWRVKGRSFLRYQVRFMVGTAYEIAAGRTSIAEITSRLDGTNKTTVHHKAPASGLILEKVEYDFERSENLAKE
ncbi:MAG TPA: tRNA pseudouridine(38-40) synthase TruA [Firmicutes bacterium]|jgi:tRNA pseudouridine synthase A|nr:tRNA pseudouridine(38-40) synthase TruA [Bacillota bacterium]HAW99911.1 tRNA pseudouridine(38-40) synthase TruA [Bacillota bacterium]